MKYEYGRLVRDLFPAAETEFEGMHLGWGMEDVDGYTEVPEIAELSFSAALNYASQRGWEPIEIDLQHLAAMLRRIPQ